MRFHVPPDLRWSAEELVRRLRALQLNAMAHQETVRVLQGPYTIRDFPLLGRGRVVEPDIRIDYLATQFLYNGEIVREVGKFPTEESVRKIEIALHDCGFLPIRDGDLDLEFSIASRYFANQTELSEKFDELRKLEGLKLDLVAHQDFENASKIRDQQVAVRARIDEEARTQFFRT